MKVSSAWEAAARPKETPLELTALLVSLVSAIIEFIEQRHYKQNDSLTEI